jgi:predicted dehydrogenase
VSTGALELVGVTPATAVGHGLLADAAAWPAEARASVIGPGADDPVAAARTAVDASRAVLIEPVGRCGVEGLRDIATSAERAGVVAAAAFRRRCEPDLAWARGSVTSGSIGLPWGIHAEALSAMAADPLSEALDLLDAVSFAAGLRPLEVVRLGASARSRTAAEGATVVLSVGLDNGAVGQVIARVVSRPPGGPRGPELASFRITGSHGTILGDLDGPALERHPDHLDVAGGIPARVDRDGTWRLVEAFRVAAGAIGHVAGSDLVGLAAAAELLALVQPTTRTRRRT